MRKYKFLLLILFLGFVFFPRDAFAAEYHDIGISPFYKDSALTQQHTFVNGSYYVVSDTDINSNKFARFYMPNNSVPEGSQSVDITFYFENPFENDEYTFFYSSDMFTTTSLGLNYYVIMIYKTSNGSSRYGYCSINDNGNSTSLGVSRSLLNCAVPHDATTLSQILLHYYYKYDMNHYLPVVTTYRMGFGVSFNYLVSDTNTIISNNNKNTQDIVNSNKTTQDKIDKTNKELEETKDFITSDEEPESDVSSLGNVQGLLPAGPVDSLLNIPFKFLSIIVSSLGDLCVPMSINWVFNESLTIPCFSDVFYDNVPSYLMIFINLIPSAFILINYFKHLYKKVERATALETTSDDEWGVL